MPFLQSELEFGSGADCCSEFVMLRANLQRTGVYAATGVPDFHGIKWQFHTDGEVYSVPVIVDDWLYFGSTDGYCYALERPTGEMRWKRHSGRIGTVNPAVDEQHLYVEGGANMEDHICAIERTTGHLLQTWVEPYGIGSPAVSDTMLYFGSITGLYALNSLTWRLVWKRRTDGWVIHPPAVAENTLYFGSFDHFLYSVHRKTGRIRWRFETGWHISMCPASAEGMVYFSSEDRHCYALNARTGRVIWTFAAHYLMTAPAVTDTLVCFGLWNGRVVALDKRTGQQQWQFATALAVPTSPSVAGDVVYFGDGDFHKAGGHIYALDLATGQERWRYEISDKVWSDVVLADDVLYVGSSNGYLYAIH